MTEFYFLWNLSIIKGIFYSKSLKSNSRFNLHALTCEPCALCKFAARICCFSMCYQSAKSHNLRAREWYQMPSRLWVMIYHLMYSKRVPRISAQIFAWEYKVVGSSVVFVKSVLKWTCRSCISTRYVTFYIMPVIKIITDYIFPYIGMTINQASMTDIWLFGIGMAGNVYEQIKGP